MQLDVLSVFQLPAASSSQSGQFFLQEDGALTLKEFQERQRRGFSWSSTCGLFACNRRTRYAVDLESSGAVFALVKGTEKPSAWVLVADDGGQSGSVRLEPLRGHHHQPTILHAPPPGLPYGSLLGMGLPPTFEREESLGNSMAQAPNMTSSQVVLEPPLGVASTRTRLIAYAYWRSSCPGKLVLAVARCDAVVAKGPSSGPPMRIPWTNGHAEEWQHNLLKRKMSWHWRVLLVTDDFDYVGPASHQNGQAPAAAPPSPRSLPILTDVRMSWHPQGSALALRLTDSGGRSCVAALDGRSLEVLWHRRLAPEPDGLISTGVGPSLPAEACASSMAWVPNTSLLAVIDSEGQLQLLDARGGRKGAALLRGAIRYGESTLVRLAPIMGKAEPLPVGAASALYESLVLSRSVRRDGTAFGITINSSGGGNAGSRVPPGQAPKPCFSLAFAAARHSVKESGPDAVPVALAAGGAIMMAVCNGTSVVLVRVSFPDGPVTPTAEYRQGLDGAIGGSGGSSPFAQAKPSPGKADDSPDRDLVPALRSGGLQVQAEGLLDNASSFGNSAVSTPYMLGLPCVSVGGCFSTATGPLVSTWRSNASDAAAAAAWPLRWRSILTLPTPGAVHNSTVPFGTAAASVHNSHWSIAGKGGPPSSLGASSLNPASKLERGGATPAGGWGAFPSPAGSTLNLLDPSLNEAASSVGWDPGPLSVAEIADGGGGDGGAPARSVYQDALASSVPAVAGAAAAPEVLLCSAPEPLAALHQGDVLVLRGSIAESLQHYPRAHVYGFLPAFLALVHLHRIDAAARLLQSYAHFTGRVAMACSGSFSGGIACGCDDGKAATAAAAPEVVAGTRAEVEAAGSQEAATAPQEPVPNATALAQDWQTTMTSILDEALIEHLGMNMGASLGMGSTVTCANAQRRSYGEILSKWQSSHQGLQEHSVTLGYEDGVPTREGLAGQDVDATADVPLARYDAVPLAMMSVNGRFGPASDRHLGCGRLSNSQSLVSAPASEVLNEAAQLRSAQISGVTPDAGVAAGVAGGNTTAVPICGCGATDVVEEPVLLPINGDVSVGSPLPSPSSALKGMFRVCLQLLLLACHAMAFVAFSAHGAGRAIAAAAAADLLALHMSPASPRSPGAGVLSRQAMRRLSSTVRMRSLKTRSVSMFGSPAFGAALANLPLSTQPTPASSVTGGFPANAIPVARTDATTPYRGGGSGAATGTVNPRATSTRQAPTAASMVIGFPIPVVWQPQSHMQLQASISTRAGAILSLSQLTGNRSTAQQPSPVPSTNVSRAGTFGGLGTEPLASFAASGSAVVSHSPPNSPSSNRPQQHQAPASMRLQLHHCAFDVTRLWQDASAQKLPLGQSAATVYLKPSYAAGLLLMAHACSVQLKELQDQQPNCQYHRQHSPHRRDGRQERLHNASSADEQLQQQGQHHHHQASGRPGQSGKPQRHVHLHMPGRMLRGNGGGGTRPARVNWQLLRAMAPATHAAAVWQQLSDWRRAALLAFACANTWTQQGGGSEDLVLMQPGGGQRRASERSAEGRTSALPKADGHLAVSTGTTAPGTTHHSAPADAGTEPDGRGMGTRCSILAAARASCLQMGQKVLLSQLVACQKMEVQDACGVMLELVALPRRLLGLRSAVHISLLQKVCTRVLDLLPARVNITPLLPAGSVPPLLQLSHAGIRSQLLAHCGAAVARVLDELRLAATCGGGSVSLRDAVQQVADHATVDSCVRMLLRWQGSYDGSRVDAAAARLAESVQDTTLLLDAADWSPEAVLPSIQDAFVTSGVLSIPDATAVVKAARIAAAAAARGSGSQLMFGLAEEQPAGGGSQGPTLVDPCHGLQDLDELALLLDLTQLQHTLLASLQPFLNDALLLLRGGAAKDTAVGDTKPPQEEQLRKNDSTAAAAAAALLPGAFEEGDQEELLDSSTLASLPPVKLAMSCLKLLLKLQWAMHCRAQVCALMLRLVRLQAQPHQPTSAISAVVLTPTLQPVPAPVPSLVPVPVAAAAIATAAAAAVGAGDCPDTFREVSQPLMRAMPSLSSGQINTSPRSFSHSSIGHRSFRDYIQHMASGTPPLGQTTQADPMQRQQPQQQLDLQPPQHYHGLQQQPQPQPQQASQHKHQQRDTGSSVQPGDTGVTRAGAGSGSSSFGVGSVPLSPQQDIAAEMERAQGSLMAWTAALVRADVFHSSSELQGCVLTVLGVVKSCPLVLVTVLNQALAWREILNKALAEQVRRLQRSAASAPPTQPLNPVTPMPAATTATVTAAVCPDTADADSSGAQHSKFATTVPSSTSFGPERFGRASSLVLPGGAMAPAPSLATGLVSYPTVEAAAAARQVLASATSGTAIVSSQPRRDRASSVALPGLPLGRMGSIIQRGLAMECGLTAVAEAPDSGDGSGGGGDDGSTQKVQPSQASGIAPSNDELLPDATTTGAADESLATAVAAAPVLMSSVASSVPPPAAAETVVSAAPMQLVDNPLPTRSMSTGMPSQPSEANSSRSSTHMHPMQLAVIKEHADILNTSMKLLEYYADPSGALPSGMSIAAAAAGGRGGRNNGGGAPLTEDPWRSGGDGAWSRSGVGSPRTSNTSVAVDGGNGGARKERGQSRMRSRSQTVSRTTPHSTLLQCLACELVRTSHAVTASVSWKATLQGGRGLAGCFVHPILHGGSSAAVASVAAAAAAAAAEGSVPGAGTGGKLRSRTAASATDLVAFEEGEGFGSVPGFVPGAEGTQALLLSLLDVRQWGVELKQLPVPSSTRRGGYKMPETSKGRRAKVKAVAAGVEAQAGAAAPVPPEAGAEVEDTDRGAEEESGSAPRVVNGDGRCYDGGHRPFSPDSGLGVTSRLSFSGLTDGDNDSSGYPTPSTAVATPASAKNPAERQANFTVRHHTNPAFGLHSPTPSNISEFWDETSDLQSPRSTMATPPRRVSRPEPSADAGPMLWRAGSSPALTDPGTSPQVTSRSPSPELQISTGMRANLATRLDRTATGDGGGVVSPAIPTPSHVVPPESQPSLQVGDNDSPRQGVKCSTVAPREDTGVSGGDRLSIDERKATSGGAEVKPAGTTKTAATAAAPAAATTMPLADDAEEQDRDGTIQQEQEQLPTLSYLIDVQALADIRKAVREAHVDRTTKASEGAITPVLTGEAGPSTSVELISTGLGGKDHGNVGGGGDEGAAVGDLSLPLVADHIDSFTVAHAASGTTFMSEISVRGDVSDLLLETGGWSGLELHDGAANDPRVSRGSIGKALLKSAAAATATVVAAGGSRKAAARRRDSEAGASLEENTCVRDGSELTFQNPASPRLVSSTAYAARDGTSSTSTSTSPALLLQPRTSVLSTSFGAAGGGDRSLPCSTPQSPQPGTSNTGNPGIAWVTLPHLQPTPHSPLLLLPQAVDATDSIPAYISRDGDGDVGQITPPPALPPRLPFKDEFEYAGLSTEANPGYQQQVLSPSACSIASSISLTSPRRANTVGSTNPGGAQQPQGYTPTHGGLMLSPGSSGKSETSRHYMLTHVRTYADPNLRGTSAVASRQPQPFPRPLPKAFSPESAAVSLRGGGGNSGAGRALQRSASASAAASTAVPSPPPSTSLSPRPLPLQPNASPQPLASSTVSPRSATSTTTSPSGDHIQIQDFFREPSTSSLSPRPLGSEFFRTPRSPGDSMARFAAASFSSAGIFIGQDGISDLTSSPPPAHTTPPPLESTATSTISSVAAADIGLLLPSPRESRQQQQQQQQHHWPGNSDRPQSKVRTTTSAESSVVRLGPGPKRSPSDAHSISHAHPSTKPTRANAPSSNLTGSSAATSPAKHFHQHHLQQQQRQQRIRGSREGLPAGGYGGPSGRRPSYEAEKATKPAAKLTGSVSGDLPGVNGGGSAGGGGVSPGVSGGGAALNPLFNAHAAAAVVFGGRAHASEQQIHGARTGDTDAGARGGPVGAGATSGTAAAITAATAATTAASSAITAAGRGSRSFSARGGGSFSRNSTGRAVWH